MKDLIYSASFSSIIMLIYLFADWIIGRIVVIGGRQNQFIRAIDKLEKEPESVYNVIQLRDDMLNFELNPIYWGVDLALISISIDIAALGIHIHNPNAFNIIKAPSEYLIFFWLLLLFGHGLLALITIYFKYRHYRCKTPPSNKPTLFNHIWQYLCNIVGFISLVSSFYIFTNSKW